MHLIKFVNIVAKVLLVGLLAHYLLNQDLAQYQNKGMPWRLVGYPLVCFIIFFVYYIRRWLAKKQFSYPHLIDTLLTLTITLDMLGNTLNFYNNITWWDDLMHLGLTVPWVLVIGIVFRMYYPQLSALNTAALTFGFGSVSHIIWEIAEYLTFVPNNPQEGPLAYRDTIGDLTLSSIGSAVGAILISTILWHVTANKSINKF